ncbi:hypothetical protein KDA14_02005, partial [Candidatus Saccharibacteria bacterium]|nr:hypothetical protein [Candidatus Saccharibacteria bacterium]
HEGRPRPYVGVSGVVNNKNTLPSGQTVIEPQDLFVEAYANRAGLFETNRMLALGVKATHVTQFQDRVNQFGPEWFPVGDELTNALRANRTNPDVLAVAQIYPSKYHISNSEYRRVLVERVAERGKGWLQAIRFDMLPWQGNEGMLQFVSDVREDYDVQTILQCHKTAMEELGPKGVVRKLTRYARALDYVMFDASHGTGERMDPARLEAFLYEAYASTRLRNVNFVVAGGLDAHVVREDLPALITKYPDLSWDAESKLHPLNNVGKRPLQMDMVKEYLRASVEAL